MDQRLSISCTFCRKSFRADRESIREGMTLRCSHCDMPVRIDAESENVSVRRVLSVARRIGMLASRLRPVRSVEPKVQKRRPPKRRRSGARS